MLIKYINKIVQLSLPVDLDIIRLKQHLPCCQITNNSDAPDIQITFIDSDIDTIEYNLNSLVIKSHWNNTWVTDLPHLIYTFLKYVFMQEHYYFLHSVMIEDTIYLGVTGAGKTTLGLEALIQNLPIGSYDKTVVKFQEDHLEYITGTDVISVRNLNPQPNLPITHKSVDRTFYNAPDLKALAIKQIVVIVVQNGPLYINEITGIQKVHHLFDWFMDSSRTDCFVQEGKLLLSPNYSQSLKQELFKNLKNLDISLYNVYGTAKDILNWSATK